MKSSEILREAARLMLESDPYFFSWCDHINDAGMALMRGLMFCPENEVKRLRGWSDGEACLALCFAAAIAESEGD